MKSYHNYVVRPVGEDENGCFPCEHDLSQVKFWTVYGEYFDLEMKGPLQEAIADRSTEEAANELRDTLSRSIVLHEDTLHKHSENVIAILHTWLSDKGIDLFDFNNQADKSFIEVYDHINKLAVEFGKKHEFTEWGMTLDWIEEIYAFADSKFDNYVSYLRNEIEKLD